jgi:hypothetical protein
MLLEAYQTHLDTTHNKLRVKGRVHGRAGVDAESRMECSTGQA